MRERRSIRWGRLDNQHKTRVIIDFRIHRTGWFYLQVCQLYLM